MCRWVVKNLGRDVPMHFSRFFPMYKLQDVPPTSEEMLHKAHDIAKEEGFPEIEAQFRNIAKVEAEHEKRYRKLLANVKEGKVFKKDEPVRWKCRNCGYIHEGPDAPDICPTCRHKQPYFEVACENY